MAVEERPIGVRIDPPEDPVRRPTRISRRGVAAIVALLAVTASPRRAASSRRSACPRRPRSPTARPEAGFTPQRTQVRLVRQGLTGHPFWAVSFSVPAPSGDGYTKLTTVRIDANTGKIEAVNRER